MLTVRAAGSEFPTFATDVPELVGSHRFDGDPNLIAAIERLSLLVQGLVMRLPFAEQVAVLAPVLAREQVVLVEPQQ